MAEDQVQRARHIGYTAAGLPVVRPLPDVACRDAPPGRLGAQHVRYGQTTGLPVYAWAWECCDIHCTDAEEEAGLCYVEADCFPYGPGPGIQRWVRLYAVEVQNCLTVRNRYADLEYDSADGKWHGTMFGLRGGDLVLTWECIAIPPPPPPEPPYPPIFRLTWSGCDSGMMEIDASCLDPLVVAYPQATFPGCCDCATDGFPVTDVAPEISFWLVTNCYKQVVARHVGYTGDGGAGSATSSSSSRSALPPAPAGLPIVARNRVCQWNVSERVDGCANMTCPVVATITAGGPCACMNGDYGMSYSTGVDGLGQWLNDGNLGCSGGVERLAMTCHDLESGMVELDFEILCGMTGIGSATVVIDPNDLEDLDVTFSIPFSDADPEFAECCASDTISVRVMRA